MLTLKTAKEIARSLGFTLSKREGEYRLAPRAALIGTPTPAQCEARAYYTADIDDAISTARAMAEQATVAAYVSEGLGEN